jgi:hypothetical protein
MAEISNGTFESGDLTGWTSDHSGTGTYTATGTVTAGAKRSGTYGARLYAATQESGQATASIYQDIDPLGFTDLDFWYKVNAVDSMTGSTSIIVSLTAYNGETPQEYNWLYEEDLPAGDWVHFVIPKIWMSADMELNGLGWGATTRLRITVTCTCSDGTPKGIEVFFDDFADIIRTLRGGDFEVENLDDWGNLDHQDGDYGVGNSSLDVAAERTTGTLGLAMHTEAESGADTAVVELWQEVSSNFSTLSFWYKVAATADGTGEFRVTLSLKDEYGQVYDYPVLDLESLTAGEWIHVTIDKDEIPLSGGSWGPTTTLKIRSRIIFLA